MRLFIYLLLSFPLLVSAQEKVTKRNCRILFLNPPADAPAKLQLYDGTTCQEVDMPEMNFSKLYTVAGGNLTLRFLRAPVVKPEEVPAGVPMSNVSENVTDCYLVVSGDPSNPVIPIRFQVIDAGEQKFRKGQMMWYNLTDQAVGGQVGKQKLAMKSQSRVVLDPPAKTSEAYDVNIAYRIPDDELLHPICQTQWIHDARSRMVVFVYGPGGRSTPQIAGFTDFRDEAKKPE